MCIVRLKKERMYVQQLVFILNIYYAGQRVCIRDWLGGIRGEGLVRAVWVGRKQISLLDVGVGD